MTALDSPEAIHAMREAMAKAAPAENGAMAGRPFDELIDAIETMAHAIARYARPGDRDPEPGEASLLGDLGCPLDLVGEGRGEIVRMALIDLIAVLRPGLEALETIDSRGSDTRPAARSLWHEYCHARTAIVALVEVACLQSAKPTKDPDSNPTGTY